MVYKFTNFRSILNKLYTDLNLTTELNESHVISWIAECLDKIGTFYQYEEITTILTLVDGKVELPCNFDKLVSITNNNRPLSWSSSSNLRDYGCEDCKITTCCTDNYFYISGNMIITDIKNTYDNTICLTYLGMPVDEEGYPLIPDDVSFKEACTKYITYMLDVREWRKGNIPDKIMERSEREALWYIGQAKGQGNMPNVAQLERLKNIATRLLPLNNEYKKNFISNGDMERKFRK